MYTAIMSDKNGATGIGLVEGYDVDQAADSEFANISTRGFVDTGDNVMIGGFILGQGDSATVLIRALGPSLGPLGVTGELPIRLWNCMTQMAISSSLMITGRMLPLRPISRPIFSRRTRWSCYFYLAACWDLHRDRWGKDGVTGVGLVEVYNLP